MADGVEQIGGLAVGKVAVAGADALLDGPGPFGVGGEEFFIVICFEVESLDPLKVMRDIVRDVAGIADESEAFLMAAEHVADRVDGIVENAESADLE